MRDKPVPEPYESTTYSFQILIRVMVNRFLNPNVIRRYMCNGTVNGFCLVRDYFLQRISIQPKHREGEVNGVFCDSSTLGLVGIIV